MDKKALLTLNNTIITLTLKFREKNHKNVKTAKLALGWI